MSGDDNVKLILASLWHVFFWILCCSALQYGCILNSVTRRWSLPHWLTKSLTYKALTLLMWPWWVMIPKEDFTDVSDGTSPSSPDTWWSLLKKLSNLAQLSAICRQKSNIHKTLTRKKEKWAIILKALKVPRRKLQNMWAPLRGFCSLRAFLVEVDLLEDFLSPPRTLPPLQGS